MTEKKFKFDCMKNLEKSSLKYVSRYDENFGQLKLFVLSEKLQRRRDTPHNDTNYNDIQHNDT